MNYSTAHAQRVMFEALNQLHSAMEHPTDAEPRGYMATADVSCSLHEFLLSSLEPRLMEQHLYEGERAEIAFDYIWDVYDAYIRGTDSGTVLGFYQQPINNWATVKPLVQRLTMGLATTLQV